MKTHPEALKILVAVANQYKYAKRDLRLAKNYKQKCEEVLKKGGVAYSKAYGIDTAAQGQIDASMRRWTAVRACYYAAKKAAGRRTRMFS